jgi:hypothetical protein
MHDSDNKCELWHKRLGLEHYGAFPILKDMVQGLSNFKIEKTKFARIVHSTIMTRLLSQVVSIAQERLLTRYIQKNVDP